MALFSGHRDVSLFRSLNKELIIDFIDTEVYYYKIITEETKTDLYNEGKDKTYYHPVKVACMIRRQDRTTTYEDVGNDYNRSADFYFLRDILVDLNIYSEVGDVIQWNAEYYTIDDIIKNQYFAGKNPETWDGGDTHGYDVSIKCSGYVTRKPNLKIVDDFRHGNNGSSDDVRIDV